MDTTQYYLSLDPWSALVQMINDTYVFQLFPGSTKLVSMTSVNRLTTTFEIEHVQSTDPANSMPPVTRTTFTFDRLDAQLFFKNAPVISIRDIRMPFSTVDILDWISERTGIVFAPDDFLHETFTAFTGNDTVTVTANPQSLRWVGQLRISLINSIKQDLATLNTVLEFPEVHTLGDGNTGGLLQQAEYYIPQFDFTPHREYLYEIGRAVFYPSGRKMAALLQAITGKPFQALPTPGAHNIVSKVENGELYYSVVYNGPPLDIYTVRLDFQRVLVLQLNPAYCTDVVGRLLVHYN